MADGVLKVMVSSNFQELQRERVAVEDAIVGQGMLPLTMRTDSAIPDRGIIQNSRKMVAEADIYVVLISNYRYGSIVDDPQENPNKYSTTELEFDHAEELGRPICAYLMDEGVYPGVTVAQIQAEAANAHLLSAFRKRAQHYSRITASFTSADDLKSKVIKTLAKLKAEQTAAKRPDGGGREATGGTTLPAPPAFVARPPHVPGHPFQGRARELALMREWATGPDPVLLFEAIGGMGKSTVTWEWASNHAAKDRTDWAGRLWYSFYERGADLRDFKVTALAYMTRQPLAAFRAHSEAELTRDLLHQLGQTSWLLVLDGLERVLAAYHRVDAAQLRDEDVRKEGDTGLVGRQPQDCIRPDDHDLLLHLASARPSKILMSSRLIPRALLNSSGEPVPGVHPTLLHGLEPQHAEAMLRRAGIQGDGERMRRYLAQAFDCHPLVVGFVAGLVRKSPWARMDFDRWVYDSRGGGAVNLADPDLRQRQTHILKLAFDALEPRAQELLARLGMLANAVSYDVVEALSPARPDPQEGMPQPTSTEPYQELLRSHLQRGLLSAEGETIDPELEWHIARRLQEPQLYHQITLSSPLRSDPRRQQELQQHHETAHVGHVKHQVALDAWRHSPALHDASRWLGRVLAELEARGLLQWDRIAETFDLHPVVRGFAVGALDPEARGRAGRRVADVFFARSQPDYENAQSPQELADRIQVARALCFAGQPGLAWNVLWPGTLETLNRLEAHHETLAVLGPMFPDGWLAPPSGVADAGLVANQAAIALAYVARGREEEAQKVLAIQDIAAKSPSVELSGRLRNHHLALRDRNELARATGVLALARDVATALEGWQHLLWCDADVVSNSTEQGRLTEARNLWADMASRAAWQRREPRLEARSLQAEAVNRHAKGTPYRRAKGTPARRLVPVVHRGDPRAAECPSRG